MYEVSLGAGIWLFPQTWGSFVQGVRAALQGFGVDRRQV